MSRVIDEHITNQKILKTFHNSAKITDIIASRQLKLLGKIARSKKETLYQPSLHVRHWVRDHKEQDTKQSEIQ